MKNIAEYAKRLEGMTKAEWDLLKPVIDETFARKQRELDEHIELPLAMVDKVIISIM